MAKIYNKSALGGGVDETLILENQDSLYYPFNVGDWTMLRIMFHFSLTDYNNDNSTSFCALPGPKESLSLTPSSNPLFRFFLGLVNAKSTPGSNQCSFVGLFSGSKRAYAHTAFDSAGSYSIGETYNNVTDTNILGAMLLNRSLVLPTTNNGTLTANGNSAGHSMGLASSITSTDNYGHILVMEFTINDKNLTTQNFDISYKGTRLNESEGKLTSAGLKSYLSMSLDYEGGISNYTTSSVDFTYSGLPLTIPNAIFIHNPFSLVNFRIHGISVGKIS